MFRCCVLNANPTSGQTEFLITTEQVTVNSKNLLFLSQSGASSREAISDYQVSVHSVSQPEIPQWGYIESPGKERATAAPSQSGAGGSALSSAGMTAWRR